MSAEPLRRVSVLFRLTAVMDVWPARAFEGCTCADENSAPCALCCDIALRRVKPSELALAKPSSGSSRDGSAQPSPAGVADASPGIVTVTPPGEVLPAPAPRLARRQRLDYRLRMVVLPFGERTICPGANVTVRFRAAHAWMPKILRAHHLVLAERFVVRSIRTAQQEFVGSATPVSLRSLTRVPDWAAVIGAVHPMQDVTVTVENAGDRIARFDALWYATAVRDEYRS